DIKLFNDAERRRALTALTPSGGSTSTISIGIKPLLMFAERARQQKDKVEAFTKT
ncbi:hypothetical protein HK405_000258, partial [Cladochytrium tenue]